MSAGSGYEDFVKRALCRELESHLERKVETEEDFRKACHDYFISSGRVKLRHMPPKFALDEFACYLCLRRAENPQVVDMDGDVIGLHRECIVREIAKYIPEMENKHPVKYERLIKFFFD